MGRDQQKLFDAQSFYSEILETDSSLLGVESCIPWLDKTGLTAEAHSYQPPLSPLGAELLEKGFSIHRGIACHRADRKPKHELDALRKVSSSRIEVGSATAIWNEYKNAQAKIIDLDITRMPADALAFYRPFHFSPFAEWGIYLPVRRLLEHCEALYSCFRGRLNVFIPETLLSAVLFEVFHHEFFHHLVESTATTMEVLSAGFGNPRRVYLDYWEREYERKAGLGGHPHHPLEEALVNAYAYNSFSFLSRVKVGYKVALAKIYQAMLQNVWTREGPGYRSAGAYIGASYIGGAAQLNAMLLSSTALDPASMLMVSKRVMPGGHTAFANKPDLPTYLVGTPDDLRSFERYVPAPNETYSSLSWLVDTDPIDRALRECQQMARKAKVASGQQS